MEIDLRWSSSFPLSTVLGNHDDDYCDRDNSSDREDFSDCEDYGDRDV